MSFPHGYRVMVDVAKASLTELEALARTAVDPSTRHNPETSARLWKACAAEMPWVITKDQPDSTYSGWVLTPSNDVELYHAGVRQITKRNYYTARFQHAYGLDGEALEERRP